jgi:hypothetical protein
MPPEELALELIGLFVFSLFSGIVISAQSSNPPKVFMICLAIDCIVVIAIALIGVACYVIAWGWRNPAVIGILAISGILVYLKYRSGNILPQGEKS